LFRSSKWSIGHAPDTAKAGLCKPPVARLLNSRRNQAEATASRVKKLYLRCYNASVTFDKPKRPIIIDRVLPDPSIVQELLVRGAPYWTVQRYVKNLSEMASLSDAGTRGRKDRPMFIAPWFRGDWAYEAPLVKGAEVFWEHEAFRNAAHQMFEGGIVVPQIVYVNLNPPIAQVDPGHVDIPAFRGIDRSQYPVWLLATMLKSGLFDRWYVPSVTAVA